MSDNPLHEGPGVLVHIPAVMDLATGDPMPLIMDVNIVVTQPNGVVTSFQRHQEDILTSTVGFNLYVPRMVYDGKPAAPGMVGEIVTAISSIDNAIDIPNQTPTDVISLVLQPGDWDVEAWLY